MNKAFKVIWNHATQTWVAASEIARAKGKTKSVKTAKTALAAAVATVAIGGTAQAATSVTATAANPVAVDGTLLAIGDGSTASNANGSGKAVAIGGATASEYMTVAIGPSAEAKVQFSTAVGAGAIANGTNSVAIGEGSKTNTQYAIAVGKETNATGLEAISLGYKNTASENYTISIGGNTQATAVSAIAMGKQATATGANSTAITVRSVAAAESSIALGPQATVTDTGDSAIAIGRTSLATGTRAIALGRTATAEGERSTAIGPGAETVADYGSALGNRAQVLAGATNGVAVGNSTVSSSENAIAIGNGTTAGFGAIPSYGVNAIAIGQNATAQASDTIVIGTNATIATTRVDTVNYSVPIQAITIGADSSANSLNATALGAHATAGTNFMNGNGTTTVGAYSSALYERASAFGYLANASANQATALGAEAEAASFATTAVGYDSMASKDFATAFGHGADALARSSTAMGPNTTVTADATAGIAIGTSSNVSATYGTALGARANVTAAAVNATAIGRLAQADHAEAVALGSNSITREATKENTATVNGVTYSGFAGNAPKSVVSFGKKDEERQLVNVAAGNISATSTDAINGSQLYFVAEQAAKPLTFTANSLKDTGANGTQQQLGSTIAIIGATQNQTLNVSTDAATVGNYSAKNIQTVVTDNQIQIQMAENPEFTSIVVKNGAGDTNPVTITSGAGSTGGTISNLASTLPGVVTVNTTDPLTGNPIDFTNNVTRPDIPASNLTNAATLGDVLNAGWNLQGNGDPVDFVKPYDTVNFENGTGTTVNITSDGNVSTIKVDVDTSTLVGNITYNTNGTVSNGTAGGDKLANVSTVVDAINKSGFTLKSSAVTGGEKDKASTDPEVINPGDVVEMIAGKNMTVKQEANGKITYATAENVSFTNVNVTSSLPTDTINVGDTGNKTETQILNLTSANPDSVVTAKDLANYGWIVATPNNSYDEAVKSQDQVNFIGDGGVVVNGKTNATTGAYDVVVKLSAAGAVEIANMTTANGTTEPSGKLAVDENETGFVTAGNVVNIINQSGWRTNSTTATGTATETLVNPGDQVNFEAGKNMVVTQDINATTGVISYTYATKDDLVLNSTTIGGSYKNEAGDVITTSPITIMTTPEGKNVINNLTTTLPPTTSFNITNDAGEVVTAPNKAAPITAQEAQNIANTSGTNAATLGDVLNAGWNLQGNGEAVDFVKPYDTVNFVNGQGTTAVLGSDGNVSTVTYNVNVDNKTTEITYADAAGNTVTKVGDKFYNPADLNEDGTPKADAKPVENVVSQISAIGPKVNGNATTGNINFANSTTANISYNSTTGDVKVEVVTGKTTTKGGRADLDGANATDIATVGDIVETINNVSWNATAGKVTGSTGEVKGNAATAVKAGDTVTLNAGNNIRIEQSGQTFNISTTENVSFTTANATTVNVGGDAGNTALTTVAGGNYNSAGQKIDDTAVPALSVGGSQITNVANGAISPSSTDAINGSQLYAVQNNFNQQIGAVNNRIDDLDSNRKAGSASAMAAAGLPQAYREGQSGFVAAVGQYEGETGVAVGFTSISDNGKWLFRGSYATNSQNENAGNLGIGYFW